MKTARQLTTAAMFFTALAFATSLRAQTGPAPAVEPVLKAIPDDALGFVLIKNLGRSDKAVARLAAMVQAPVPDVLSLLKAQGGIQEGLDENGSAAVALVPISALRTADTKLPPSLPVVFLPVTDYKKFIAPFQPDDATAETTGVTIAGHALRVGRKDSFAAFTLPEGKELLAKVIDSKRGIDSQLESIEPWIGRHCVSVILSRSGSNLFFQMGANTSRQIGAVTAGQQKQLHENGQDVVPLNWIFEGYAKFYTKASEEVAMFAVGLSLDERNNLSIDSHTTFVAGGDWDAAMKALGPSDRNDFAGVADAPFAVAFEGRWPTEWSGPMADWSATVTSILNKAGGGEELSEQQRRTYVEAMQSILQGFHSMAFVMATPKPGGTLYDGIVGSMKVDDAPKFLVRYQQAIEQLRDIMNDFKKSFFKFSDVKKIELEGHSGLEVTIDMSGMLTMANDPATAKVMPRLFGPDGKLTMRILVADDHTLVAAYGTEEHAKEALATFKNPGSSLASDPEVATTLKLLPSHGQWVGLLSLKGYVDLISGVMSAAVPAGAPMHLPEFPSMPPIGFAAEASGIGLDTQLVLPAETIVGISKVVHHAMGPPSRPAAN